METNLFREALFIRMVEEKLLELFSKGKLNGTVHTCIGQEFSAIAFAGQLEETDFIFSNHRCHGHFTAFTKEYRKLFAELMGKSCGVCGGIGGSQHLYHNNCFFSNGIQGGIVPVAAGIALGRKLQGEDGIGTVFIGDGTLGQGVIYETMNIASLWELPLLIVCENNLYAQSTPQSINLAGNILDRAKAFSIRCTNSNTWQVDELMDSARESIEYVRKMRKPCFHLVDTYRLAPHSKGDDNRSKEEIEKYRSIDPLNVFFSDNKEFHKELLEEFRGKIDGCIAELESTCELPLNEYVSREKPVGEKGWKPLVSIDSRIVERINSFFLNAMERDPSLLFIGEDVASPYGGAFKVARSLSEKFPSQVFSTPISEAAITGISNGLALSGMRPFLEIMFGDFITLSLDQILNHASKFSHMYNKQVDCPIVIRTPMGGGRGYGPTHSQTLDKFIVGIDNVTTLALNTLIDPHSIYEAILSSAKNPTIVIENKLDYGRRVFQNKLPNYIFEQDHSPYPTARVRPQNSAPDITIVTYGGMTDMVLDIVMQAFFELDIKTEVIIPTCIHPLDMDPILDSVRTTQRLFIVEEGSRFAGVGSEIIAEAMEAGCNLSVVRRISATPVPIPSARSLESEVLPSKEKILGVIGEALK